MSFDKTVLLDSSVGEKIDAFITAVERIGYQLGRIADAIRPRPKQPRPLSIRVLSERHTDMADLLKFVVSIPAAEGDVVKRVGAVTLPDESVVSFEIEGKDAGESPEFEVPQDATVKVSCVNVDDAGNESEPRVQDFVILDTIAPASPGELGVRVTSERTEETPPSE